MEQLGKLAGMLVRRQGADWVSDCIQKMKDKGKTALYVGIDFDGEEPTAGYFGFRADKYPDVVPIALEALEAFNV